MKVNLNKHDLILISGIVVFFLLIRLKGLSWAFDQFASFYVAITVFNWIKEKIGEKSE